MFVCGEILVLILIVVLVVYTRLLNVVANDTTHSWILSTVLLFDSQPFDYFIFV